MTSAETSHLTTITLRFVLSLSQSRCLCPSIRAPLDAFTLPNVTAKAPRCKKQKVTVAVLVPVATPACAAADV